MTTDDLKGITFRCISHANYTDEYIAVYESTNFTPIITVKVFTKRIGLCEIGNSRIVYHFNGKNYRSKASLVKAINELKSNNNEWFRQEN